jgi:DNA repair protein RadA
MTKKEKKKAEIGLADVPGVGPATVEKLIENGYDTLMSIATASPGQLVDSTGMGEVSARKIITFARNSCDLGFHTGEEVMEQRLKVERISTGSDNFDELLGGGFETGSITECFAEFGGGKTQIGHILAVNCQKLDPKAICIYVDSENSFRPERITQLAEGAGLEPDKVLKHIKVGRAFNSDHQILLAEKIGNMIEEQKLNVKVVVIDSLTAHFRAEYVGRGTLAERQQKLNRHLSALAKLADIKNLCVYVTNQVMADPAQFFGDPTKAVGGHILGHASKTRIYLRKGKKGSRVAKLIDSPNLPDGEVNFVVEAGGLKDL